MAGGDHTKRRSHVGTVEALLMGRKTYEGLAGYWSAEQASGPTCSIRCRSSWLREPCQGPLEWNATLIEGDAAEGVSKLKEDVDGDLFLDGLRRARAFLLAEGLIDELDFWIHPATVGRSLGHSTRNRTRN